MARSSIKLDRPLMSQDQWFNAAAENLAWIEDGADDEWWPWLVRETERLGARRVQRWLCDDGVTFGRYDAGLCLAEHCGLT